MGEDNTNPRPITIGMEILGKLFGSNAIIRILRLFLFNPGEIFQTHDIVKRTRVASGVVRIEIGMMERIGLVKKKSFYVEVEKKKGKRKIVTKKKVRGFMLDKTFVYLKPLQNFFIETAPINQGDLLRKLRRGGKLKLVIISGFFLHELENRVDILIAGDALKRSTLDTVIKNIEAEMGKELKCAVFSTADFRYRFDIRDRLIRDVFDYPHIVLLDSLNLTP